MTQTPEDYFGVDKENEEGEKTMEKKDNSIKVEKGEQREAGWMYFVKGENLEIFKCKMLRRKNET